MNEILIIGSTGMLGSELCKILNNKKIDYHSISTTNSNDKNHYRIDIKNIDINNLKNEIGHLKPNLIINCAAIIDLSFCANNCEDAFELNSLTNLKLYQVFGGNAKIIFVSSDAVFSEKDIDREINSITTPSSIYGISKLLGELINKDLFEDFINIRTTIVGKNPKSNISSLNDWIINSLRNNKQICLYEDVFFSPIHARVLADIILEKVVNVNYNGNLHLVSDEIISKYEYGIILAKEFDLDSSLIIKVRRNADSLGRCNNQFLQTHESLKILNADCPKLIQTIKLTKLDYL